MGGGFKIEGTARAAPPLDLLEHLAHTPSQQHPPQGGATDVPTECAHAARLRDDARARSQGHRHRPRPRMNADPRGPGYGPARRRRRATPTRSWRLLTSSSRGSGANRSSRCQLPRPPPGDAAGGRRRAAPARRRAPRASPVELAADDAFVAGLQRAIERTGRMPACRRRWCTAIPSRERDRRATTVSLVIIDWTMAVSRFRSSTWRRSSMPRSRTEPKAFARPTSMPGARRSRTPTSIALHGSRHRSPSCTTPSATSGSATT